MKALPANRCMYPLPLRLLAVLLLAGTHAACRGSEGEQAYHFTRFAMDTVVEYTIVAPDHQTAREAMLAAQNEIERIELLLWEENPDGAVYRLNRGDVTEVDGEVAAFLARSLSYAELSGGAFDITVGPLLNLYGFTGDRPRRPSDDEIAAALTQTGYQRVSIGAEGAVELAAGAELAVGGVAKGYAVDRAIAVLRERGIEHAMVNAGGDLYAMGTIAGRPWRVGIRHPDDAGEIVEVLHVSDAGVATSGDYQRFFEHDGVRYHHILDPATGRPARSVRSATVVAPTAEEADALATALFVRGAEGLEMIGGDHHMAVLVMVDGAVIRIERKNAGVHESANDEPAVEARICLRRVPPGSQTPAPANP